ncbi:predicted protein, partial [Nematostella vectensis]
KQVGESLLLQPVDALVGNIRDNTVTAEEVMRAYIKRILEVNPMVNAITNDRFDEALEEARRIDEILGNELNSEEKKELLAKPLLGVPITVKESISCRGMPHSSGLVERKNVISEHDSEVVENLRQNGAIPMAVTNCSELCMWWETVNNVYGRTRNPYDTSRVAGGSSGGEGAIIAAAGSLCGVGSDVGGSIRMPAFFNGISGHKPSPGIVPNHGHYPYGTSEAFHEYLSIGPLCRYASDLSTMLKAMSGPNAYRLGLDEPVDLSSIKVFTVKNFDPTLMAPVSEDLKMAEKKAVDYLQSHFGTKYEQTDLRYFRYAALIWAAMVMSSEDKKLTSKFLEGNSGSINPFLEMLKYLVGSSQYHFITPVVGSLEKLHCFDTLSSTFVTIGNKLRLQLESLLGDNGVLLFPSHPRTAMPHGMPVLSPLDFNYTSIFNVLRMPVTQCPLGLDSEGMPLGIQIAAACNNDRLTLAVARALEQKFGGWSTWQPCKHLVNKNK